MRLSVVRMCGTTGESGGEGEGGKRRGAEGGGRGRGRPRKDGVAKVGKTFVASLSCCGVWLNGAPSRSLRCCSGRDCRWWGCYRRCCRRHCVYVDRNLQQHELRHPPPHRRQAEHG